MLFSRILAFILHPVFMTTYAGVLYYYAFPTVHTLTPEKNIAVILAVIFIATAALPLLSMLILLRFGKIQNLEMSEQQERNWPLIQTAVIYLIALYALKSEIVPAFLQIFILGAVGGMVIALIINLKWKISLHLIGMGGLCGAFFSGMVIYREGQVLLLSILLLTAGLLGTTRLLLREHTLTQVFTGFLTGFLIEVALLLFAAIR
ncbi:MAG: membrane protein [Bacteroidia bacterium]